MIRVAPAGLQETLGLADPKAVPYGSNEAGLLRAIGPRSAVPRGSCPCDTRHLSGVPGGPYHWGMTTWRIGPFLVVGALACSLDVGGTTFVPPPPPATPTLQLVVQGLTAPLFLTAPPCDTTRQFIVQQDGRIRVVRNDTLLTTPFLDIHTQVTYVAGGQQGPP